MVLAARSLLLLPRAPRKTEVTCFDIFYTLFISSFSPQMTVSLRRGRLKCAFQAHYKEQNQRRMAIAQWRHQHLLSGRAVSRCLLSCQLCFIQLHHREEIPAQAEPSAMTSFGTSALVAVFRRRSGADGLIGSRPCGAPSGWSAGSQQRNAARFFYGFPILKAV